jgi:hypothetical protein
VLYSAFLALLFLAERELADAPDLLQPMRELGACFERLRRSHDL